MSSGLDVSTLIFRLSSRVHVIYLLLQRTCDESKPFLVRRMESRSTIDDPV